MTPIPQAPTAAQLFLAGFSRIVDAAGVVLLVVLGYRMFFVFDSSLQTRALAVGVLGTAACWMDRRAARDAPVSLLGFVAVGLLSAAVNRWAAFEIGAQTDWLALFEPASHLVVMAVFVYGTAHLLRTPGRLSLFVVAMVGAICVLAVEIVFDRVSADFIYRKVGTSLPSLPHWSGVHGTSLFLTLGLPLTLSVAFVGRSGWRSAAGILLAGGFFQVAYLNGSRGGMVSMTASVVLMAGTVMVARLRHRRHARLTIGGGLLLLAVVGGALVWNRESFGMNDLSGRGLIWEATARLALDHWGIGVGPGNLSNAMFETSYPAEFLALVGDRFYNAHNLFLHVGAETGVFGVLFLAGLLAWALRSCWCAWTQGYLPTVALGLLFALTGFLVHSLTENFLDARAEVERTRLIVWLVLAAVLALARLSRCRATTEQ